jgi:hypothetical protein
VNTTRREFLTLLGAAGAAATAPSLLAAPATESFTFLFVTDTHIQPELNAAKGTEMAFKKARGIKADFAIQGGDHVFDSLAVPKERALSLFDLYAKTEQDLGMKVHHTIGNHDVVGIFPKSGVAPTDPLYGKKLFEQRFGKSYYSFDHKGHHFLVLDSIGVTSDRAYEGRIDAEQMQWISRGLATLPKGTPIIVSVHIPLVSAFSSYVPLPAKPEPHHGLTVAMPTRSCLCLRGTTFWACCRGIPTSTNGWSGTASRTSPAEPSLATGGREHGWELPRASR